MTDKCVGNHLPEMSDHYIIPLLKYKKGNKGEVKHSNLGNSSVVRGKTAQANSINVFIL